MLLSSDGFVDPSLLISSLFDGPVGLKLKNNNLLSLQNDLRNQIVSI